MSAEKFIQLKEDEKIVLMVRRYLLTYFWWYLGIFILLVGPFFFLFPLLGWGKTGKIIFTVSILLGIYYWIKLIFLWKRNCLIITNQRIVDIHQKGFTKRSISGATYEKIADVGHVVKGGFASIFKYGSLVITCGGGSVKLNFHKIHKPQHVHDVINEMIEKYFNAKGYHRKRGKSIMTDEIKRMSEDELEAVASIVLTQIEKNKHNQENNSEDEN